MDFENKSIEQIEEILCFGQCYPTAIAMNEALSWPIGALMVDWKERSWLPHIVHAYLIAPDGRAFDAAGFKSTEEILEHFITPERERECRNIRFTEYPDADEFVMDLRRCYLGSAEDENHSFYDPAFDPRDRTTYDDFLDEHLPSIREAVIEKLDVVGRALYEFPALPAAA
jgi:hypothetical protein